MGADRAMKKYIGKLIRFPVTVARLIIDKIIALAVCRASGMMLDGGVSFVGIPHLRIAPSASVRIGKGCRFCSRPDSNVFWLSRPVNIVAKGDAIIDIGEGVGLSGVSIVSYSGVSIGAHTLIGAETVIVDTDCHPLLPEMRRVEKCNGCISKPIHIGSDVFIGSRAIILKGVSIGDGSVIGAGSVITSDVPARTVVAGNPARIVKTI